MNLVQCLVPRKILSRVLQQPSTRNIFKGAFGSNGEIVHSGPYFAPFRNLGRFYRELRKIYALYHKYAPRRQTRKPKGIFKIAYIIQEDRTWKDCVMFNEMVVLDLGKGEIGRECRKQRGRGLWWIEFENKLPWKGKEKLLHRIAFRESSVVPLPPVDRNLLNIEFMYHMVDQFDNTTEWISLFRGGEEKLIAQKLRDLAKKRMRRTTGLHSPG